MEYARYGKNGPMVSRLGFGLMRLPVRKQDDETTVNFPAATRVIRAALEAGVNFFDSHHNYHNGNSEVAFGKALKGWKGPRVYLQTKTTWYRPEPISFFKQKLEEALEKLGVESIDYLLFHSKPMTMWMKPAKSFIRCTDWALRKGYIQHRGFSSHETPENVRKFIDTGEFSVMLLSYNWMDPREREVIAYGASKGMGVSVMNPLGGGALAVSTPQVMKLLPGAKSASEIGLRYVLSTPGVATALSGMRTVEQVEENVRIVSRKTMMTTKQRQGMKKKLAAIKREENKFCTACGYCTPCPHGVDIPQNFRLLNRIRFFGQVDWATWWWRRLRNSRHGDRSALTCKKCRKCLPKCPNNIPIIDQLAEVAATMEKLEK